MADDVKRTTASAAADRAPAHSGSAPAPAGPGAVYVRRFRAAYFVLAMLLGAAAGTFVLLAGNMGESGPRWSTWKPDASGEARAWQIADHVSRRYLHPSGRPLVSVLTGPLTAQSANPEGTPEEVPIKAILVRGRTRDFSDAQVERVSSDNTLMFALCGGGENCTFDEGAPSQERGLQLRREVLELALYAYRYHDDLDRLVTFLPPFKAEDANDQAQTIQRLVYLKRADVAHLLKAPLGVTLPGRPMDRTSAKIERAIDGIVLPNLYQYRVERAPQGDALLILAALAA